MYRNVFAIVLALCLGVAEGVPNGVFSFVSGEVCFWLACAARQQLESRLTSITLAPDIPQHLYTGPIIAQYKCAMLSHHV